MDIRCTQPAALGQAAEMQACRYLTDRGLQLITRNYRCRHGEIDLVMRDGRTVVFVEVRYRGNRNFADGAESVDRRKQSKLVATALHYLQRHPDSASRPARFDVIAIAANSENEPVQWISNAFGVDS